MPEVIHRNRLLRFQVEKVIDAGREGLLAGVSRGVHQDLQGSVKDYLDWCTHTHTIVNLVCRVVRVCVCVCDSSWTGCYDLAKKTSAFQVQNERRARGTGVNLSCVSLHTVSGRRPWVQEESGKLAPSDDLA